MSNILDRISASRGRIIPSSEAEFIALQLARALGDEAHCYDYLLLAKRYTIPLLLHAFRAVRNTHPHGWSILDHFRNVVETAVRTFSIPHPRLIAFRIERRQIALAVFEGLRLDFSHLRNLPVYGAERSVTGFFSWAIAQFPTGSIALEAPGKGRITKQHRLSDALVSLVRTEGLPLVEMAPDTLIAAFGEPQPKRRSELRSAAASIWPQLPSQVRTRAALDAAALGLFVQVRRLLDSEVSPDQG